MTAGQEQGRILLQAQGLSRTLPAEVPVRLVRHADFSARSGEFVTITGPSGSGKSSLLYLLGLLDRPDRGRLQVDGVETTGMSEEERSQLRLSKMGFIFQSHFLLPEFSALENVMMPIKRLGRLGDAACRALGLQLLDDVGLSAHAHKRPRQLSGGQSQRVAIARALANDPLIILADEPTGNLDTVSSQTVQDILRGLAHGRGRCVIAVTHDMDFANRADRRVHIVDGVIEKAAAA